jgi:osmotically-inducible protein OsmY
VTITGDAPSQAIKDRVTEKVRAVDGVKDVVNDLEVKPAKEPSTKNPK